MTNPSNSIQTAGWMGGPKGLPSSVMSLLEEDRAMFFLSIRQPPKSPLFPYTTLFRSVSRTYLLGGEGDLRIHCPAEKRLHQANRSEEHTSELQSLRNVVCLLLL